MITINWCWLHTFRRLTGYPGYSIVLGFTQNVLLRKRKYQDWYTFLWIHGKFYSFSSIESIEIKLEIKMIFHDYLWISENFYDLGSFVAKFCLAGFPHFSAIFVGWKEVTTIECMVGLVMTIYLITNILIQNYQKWPKLVDYRLEEGDSWIALDTNWNLETELQSFKFRLPQTTFETGQIKATLRMVHLSLMKCSI